MTKSQDEQQTTPSPDGLGCSGESSVQPAALLPCPFCGNVESLRVTMRIADVESDAFYMMNVECDECSIEGPTGYCGSSFDARVAMEDAVSQWNQRAGQNNNTD